MGVIKGLIYIFILVVLSADIEQFSGERKQCHVWQRPLIGTHAVLCSRTSDLPQRGFLGAAHDKDRQYSLIVRFLEGKQPCVFPITSLTMANEQVYKAQVAGHLYQR